MSYKRIQTDEEYYALKHYSFSSLRYILPPYSPAHFKNYIDKGGIETTAAMEFGKAEHTILLEPDKFDEIYSVYDNPFPDYRKQEARDRKNEFIAKALIEGRKVVDKKTYDELAILRDIAKQNEQVFEVLRHPDSENETGLVWQEPTSGAIIKTKWDNYLRNKKFKWMHDLKTCTDVTNKGINKAITSRCMFMQAAMYIDAALHCYGEVVDMYFIIFIDKVNKMVRVVPLNPSDIEVGRRLYRMALGIAEECKRLDYYPYSIDYLFDDECTNEKRMTEPLFELSGYEMLKFEELVSDKYTDTVLHSLTQNNVEITDEIINRFGLE